MNQPICWTYAGALVASLLFLAVFWGNAIMLLPDAAAFILEALRDR